MWFNIGLFLLSFLLVAMLTPKPNFEDAKAQDLDPDTFPKASESDPILLVLGCARVDGPNTLWYGDFKTKAMTKRVRTGLFSRKTVTLGYEYFLGFDLAICLGPNVRLHKIFIDEKEVKSKPISDASSNWSAVIKKRDLFGGREEGGGFVSDFTFYRGSKTQAINTYVQGKSGLPQIPAYNGLSHIVFEGAYIGEQPNLKKISFMVGCYPEVLGTGDSRRDLDMCLAEAVAYLLTEDYAALDFNTNQLNLQSFISVQNILSNEGHYGTVKVGSSKNAKEIINEILRQIDGVIYEDPDDGLINLKLIRADGNPPDTYDEDDIVEIRGFTKTSWEDVVSEVKVKYSKRDGEGSAIALAQDAATMNMIGRKKSTIISYPFCYNADTANALAARELSRLSQPIYRMTLVMNRKANAVRPGDRIKVSWPEYGIVNLILRVQKYNLGELNDNKMVLECMQDIFSVDAPVMTAPTGSAWVAPITEPQPITNSKVVEIPYFLDSRLEYPSIEDHANVMVLARQPSTASTGYTARLGLQNNDLSVIDPENSIYSHSFFLENEIAEMDGWLTGVISSITVNSPIGQDDFRSYTVGENRDADGLMYVNGEWMTYRTLTDNGDDTFTLGHVERALLGSIPKKHVVNQVVYMVTVDQLGQGEIGADLPDTGTVYSKVLDRIGGATYDEDLVSVIGTSMNQEAARPLRPRLLTLDSDRENIEIVSGTFSVVWRPSNKNSSDIEFESDPAATPNPAETYRLELWMDGSEYVPKRDTSATTPYSLDLNGVPGENAELRIYSESGGLLSKNYAWLTFLLNANLLVPSGDMQDGNTKILLSGDAQQTGIDKLKVSGA